MDLLIRNGRVVDPANGLDAPGDVLIQAGRVARVGPRLEAPAGTETIDVEGRVIAPGFIDIHVHLREPGQEYKETIASGTRAAAAGGFAAVACMANTQPVNDTRAVTDYILAEARARGIVRVYPIGAVTRGLGGRELAELGELAEAGCVAYSDDGRPVMNSAVLRRALEYAQAFGRPIISHAEDAALSEGGVMHEGFVSTDLGLRGIPAAAEEIMVARDIALADLTGTPVHIAHVSTAAAVRLLREAKARGVAVTGEVTPHHLLLTDEALRAYDPNAKMAPPLRSKRDVEACREALADGTLDAIATDHAPHALTDKEVELDHAANGIVGLETAVALCLTHLVRERVGRVVGRDRVEGAVRQGFPARLEALADGTLDAIATDHAPHALTDKEVELDHAANGIVGLETAVALCLTHLVRERVLDLPTLIARLTAGPARVLGLPGGSLAPGAPGDVTVLDLAHEHVIEPARFRSKARNTPFGGRACVGGPWLTVVGGRVAMRAGIVAGESGS